VEKRGGKHGRVEVNAPGDRLLLHYPICMTNPESPLCDKSCVKHFTQPSGKIHVRNYNSFMSCMWTIEVPAGSSISFKFEKRFDLEFHHRCGYDRVHIFSGTIDGETQRQGRFCGPKPSSSKPYDGSKRNVETNGVMPFWDTAYDIQSNTAIVGFDSDQTYVGGGFTLSWNSHPVSGPVDFTNVFAAHQYLSNTSKMLFKSVMFQTDKGMTHK